MSSHAGKADLVKFIDYDNLDDDDTDSLASALSDYNSVFYGKVFMFSKKNKA